MMRLPLLLGWIDVGKKKNQRIGTGLNILYDCVRVLIVVLGFLVLALAVLFVGGFPFGNLAFVGLLAVEVGEDEFKHFRVPADGVALNALLNVLRYG